MTNNSNEVRKYVELADFKESAATYYKELTKHSPQKGIGSHEYIYFTYGIEWAFNHLPQKNDSLIEENKMLLEALKKFLQVINRSDAALYHYKDAITFGEELIKRAENK